MFNGLIRHFSHLPLGANLFGESELDGKRKPTTMSNCFNTSVLIGSFALEQAIFFSLLVNRECGRYYREYEVIGARVCDWYAKIRPECAINFEHGT